MFNVILNDNMQLVSFFQLKLLSLKCYICVNSLKCCICAIRACHILDITMENIYHV